MSQNNKDAHSIGNASLIRVSPDAVSSRVADQVVLVHLKTDRIFTLNKTAARLWDLLSAGTSLNEIQRTLAAEFDVANEQLEKEIENLLISLQDEEFITLESET